MKHQAHDAPIKEELRHSKIVCHPLKKWAKDMNGHFSKEDIGMANKHMRWCPTSLLIREIQIKTAVRCHFTPIRVTTLKTNKKPTQNITSMGKDMDGAIGTLVHCWWECKMVQSLWKPLKCCIEKVKNEVTIGSSNPTSGYSPNEPKAGPQREYSHTYVRSSAIHNCQEWKQANCHQWMNGYTKCVTVTQ